MPSTPALPVVPPTDLDGLVVTALKRSSLAQQTPLSMVVVDGEQLARMAMTNIEQAAPMLPGLKLISTAFGRRLVLRGVYGAGEATTGLYYDETPMSSATDDVESATPSWEEAGTIPDIWSRALNSAGTSHVWKGVDFGAASDTSIASPDLQVSPTDPFTISFTHRYRFEFGQGTA